MFGAVSCRFTVEYVSSSCFDLCIAAESYVGIRMILKVSYGSSNQSALPEMSYQFWIGQFGINTSCEM